MARLDIPVVSGTGGSSAGNAAQGGRSDQHDIRRADIDAAISPVADQAAHLAVNGGDQEAVFLMAGEDSSASLDSLKGLLFQPNNTADVFFEFVHFSVFRSA